MEIYKRDHITLLTLNYIYDELIQIGGNNPQEIYPRFKNVAARIKSITIEAIPELNINITELEAKFINLYPEGNYRFSTATGRGSPGEQNISFTVPGTTRSVSATAPTGGSLITGTKFVTSGSEFFEITKMSAGGATVTNIRPFASTRLVPGMIYNLKLTIRTFRPLGPGDVEVNGQIWMNYNLGADPNFPTPNDYTTFTKANFGDYYLFGKKEPFISGEITLLKNNTIGADIPKPGALQSTNAYPFPMPIAGSGYYMPQTTLANSGVPVTDNWKLGTETEPIKNTDRDPCPTNYRVPTRTEAEALLNYLQTGGSIVRLSAPDALDRKDGKTAYQLTKPVPGEDPIVLTFAATGYYTIAIGDNNPFPCKSSAKSGQLKL